MATDGTDDIGAAPGPTEYKYFEAAGAAWRELWRNPALWLLGALASLGTGGGPRSSSSASFGGSPNSSWVEEASPGTALPGGATILESLRTALIWLAENAWIIVAVLLGIALLSIVAWLISCWFGAALIRGSAIAVTGVKVRFFESVSGVRGRVLRYMGLIVVFDLFRLLTVLLILVPIVVLALGALSAFQWGTSDISTEMVDAGRLVLAALLTGPVILFVIGAALLAIPVHFLLALIQEMSARRLVLDGEHVRSSLSYGLGSLAATPGRILLVGVIGYAIGAVGALALSIVALIILAVPAVLAILAIIGLVSSGSIMAAVGLGVLAIALFLPLLLFLGGVVQAYMALYWTHSYRSLQPFLVSSSA